jgi:hypothetical protein
VVLMIGVVGLGQQLSPKICAAAPPCISADSTLPPALTSPGGSGEYRFRFTADANDTAVGHARKFIYEHCIRNLSPDRVLHAAWDDGAIPFQAFAPCQCISGLRESTIESREKPDSIILYGLTKQPQMASAYVKMQPPQSARTGQFSLQTDLPPDLRTHFFLNVDDKAVSAANVTFTTSLRPGRQFVYRIQNAGTADVLFTIDSLLQQWLPFDSLTTAIQKSTWTRNGNTNQFFLKSRTTAELSVAATDVSAAREESADLTLIAFGTGKEVGRATVSVYIPSRPQ